MVEPSGHCPYLGLKQNQAIRFASPTPEHRCYVTGQAQDIPTFEADYQAHYCLAPGHIRCPLYTGSGLPSMPPVPPAPPVGTAGGLRGWFIGLSRRDRAIYMGLLALLVFIFAVYTAAGFNLLRSNGFLGGTPPLAPAPTADSDPLGGAETEVPPSETPTLPPPSETPTLPPPSETPTLPPPSETPTLPPSDTPTLPPTNTALPPPPPPTETPTATRTPSDLVPLTPTTAPPTDTPGPPSETPTDLPTVEPSSTSVPEPPFEPSSTSVPEPPFEPSSTSVVQPPPEPARTPDPQPPPQGQQEQQRLTIYFSDATGTLYVSVARLSTVVDRQVAQAAIGGLIAGPGRPGLEPLIPPETRLIEARREGSRMLVNFDRRPAWPNDDRGLYAIAYTLTEFATVNEVQIQVNGANIGVNGGSGPIVRQTLNPDNPQGLSERFDSGTRFLPLYFLDQAAGGVFWVRVTRLAPRTDDVARATLDALLAGPGSYGGKLYSPIPAGTRLSGAGLRGDGRRVVVDLSREFLDAHSRQAAVDALVYSLTELRDPAGARQYQWVEILVEGRKLSDHWGPAFDRQFERKWLNPQG